MFRPEFFHNHKTILDLLQNSIEQLRLNTTGTRYKTLRGHSPKIECLYIGRGLQSYDTTQTISMPLQTSLECLTIISHSIFQADLPTASFTDDVKRNSVLA
jgi:hypothetical protein